MLCDKLTNIESIIDSINKNQDYYDYYHYSSYPAVNKSSWHKVINDYISESLNNTESIVFYNYINCMPFMIIAKISEWDHTHFGFKLASLNFLSPRDSISNSTIPKLLSECENHLKSFDVKFISARINGDALDVIHALESNGYKYIEDVIWPVLDCRYTNYDEDKEIRAMNEGDIDSVAEIASNYQYQRGHYHCDDRFEKSKVNDLYAKWAITAFSNKEPVIVVESEGKVRGYFVIKIDLKLSNYLGYTYGRMRSLAIDGSCREKGLGKRIFRGAICHMKKSGAEFIDSGYSTKNHVSASLHTKEQFRTVYEEVTFHKWLN